MGLFVTYNGENVDPEKFVLLYMPLECADKVQEYLGKHKLTNKFQLIHGEVSAALEEDSEVPLANPVKTLVLMMRSDKVLFEYKLSGKHYELTAKITEYVYGSEEKE